MRLKLRAERADQFSKKLFDLTGRGEWIAQSSPSGQSTTHKVDFATEDTEITEILFFFLCDLCVLCGLKFHLSELNQSASSLYCSSVKLGKSGITGSML